MQKISVKIFSLLMIVVLGSCGDYMRLLKSDREAGEVATQLRKAVRGSLKGRRTTRIWTPPVK